MTTRLVLRFEQPSAFATEYERNIGSGGAFIPTEVELDLRSSVEVELVLAFHGGESFREMAEVVHCGAGPGGRRGVAVQFHVDAAVLRERFGALAARIASEAIPAPDRDQSLGRAPRIPVQMPVRLATSSAELGGITRDVSATGVLVSADASDLPRGKHVRVEMRHPETGEVLEVDGVVTRHLGADGTVAAVAVEFDPGEVNPDVAAFVAQAQRVGEDRAAKGIRGSLADLGLPTLLEMLGKSTPRGTLTARCDAEEGIVCFENGLLRSAHLGSLHGVKALARMATWENGDFHFLAQAGPAEGEEAMPLDAALFEALRQVDEARRIAGPDPAVSYRVDPEAREREGDLDKTEEAVLDLAAAGITVRRILDVIPEDDGAVVGALVALEDRGILVRK